MNDVRLASRGKLCKVKTSYLVQVILRPSGITSFRLSPFSYLHVLKSKGTWKSYCWFSWWICFYMVDISVGKTKYLNKLIQIELNLNLLPPITVTLWPFEPKHCLMVCSPAVKLLCWTYAMILLLLRTPTMVWSGFPKISKPSKWKSFQFKLSAKDLTTLDPSTDVKLIFSSLVSIAAVT